MHIPALTRYVALPASAALLVLTGCASTGSNGGPAVRSSTDKASPLKLIKATYTATTTAKSARIAVTVAGPNAAASADAVLNGVEDFEHKSSETTSSLAGAGTIEQRQIGPDIYVKLPSALAAMQLQHDASKPWTHIRIPKNLTPAALSSVLGAANADPTDALELLNSVTSSVTAVGTDDIRGQRSTHYRMTFDEAKIRKLDDQQMGDCADDEPTAGTTSGIPLNVWLDGQGRLTRMQMSTTPRNTDAPGAITIEFYDYGTPVSIEAPPADQTQTINDAFGDSSSCTGSGSASVPPTVGHS